MGKYDFDTVIDRKDEGNSVKWHVKDDSLPMWVADMDFKAAPEILAALEKRVAHGVFGYSYIPEEWYQAYQSWWSRRYSFEIKKNWLCFASGVIPAISSVIRKLTNPKDKVMLFTPVYNIFFNCIIDNDRTVEECKLLCKDGGSEIDWADFEEKLKQDDLSLLILCNPHNPTGRIWKREEMEKIGELALKNNVVVLSDEIHCDLTEPGTRYIPYASVSDACRDNSITCVAPTKSFNIAGLHTSAVIIPKRQLRFMVGKALATDQVASNNAFAVDATIAAYEKSEEWLDELNAYVFENKKFFCDYVKKNIPQVKAYYSKSTYLLWIDTSAVCDDSDKLEKIIKDETGLWIISGKKYSGNGFMRINLAAPRSVVLDGAERLKKAVESLN